jgi:hypothetical protein
VVTDPTDPLVWVPVSLDTRGEVPPRPTPRVVGPAPSDPGRGRNDLTDMKGGSRSSPDPRRGISASPDPRGRFRLVRLLGFSPVHGRSLNGGPLCFQPPRMGGARSGMGSRTMTDGLSPKDHITPRHRVTLRRTLQCYQLLYDTCQGQLLTFTIDPHC